MEQEIRTLPDIVARQIGMQMADCRAAGWLIARLNAPCLVGCLLGSGCLRTNASRIFVAGANTYHELQMVPAAHHRLEPVGQILSLYQFAVRHFSTLGMQPDTARSLMKVTVTR